MKKYAKVVFVDQKESNTLPKEIRTGLFSAGNTMPMVVFFSPNGQTKFGAFDKKALNNQKYSTIFKDVKLRSKKLKTRARLKIQA
jgi:hypothetical protein